MKAVSDLTLIVRIEDEDFRELEMSLRLAAATVVWGATKLHNVVKRQDLCTNVPVFKVKRREFELETALSYAYAHGISACERFRSELLIDPQPQAAVGRR